jgi:hypothetical protein
MKGGQRFVLPSRLYVEQETFQILSSMVSHELIMTTDSQKWASLFSIATAIMLL